MNGTGVASYLLLLLSSSPDRKKRWLGTWPQVKLECLMNYICARLQIGT